MAEQFFLKTVLHNGFVPIYFEIPIPQGIINALTSAPVKSADITFHSKDEKGVSIEPDDTKEIFVNIKVRNDIYIPIVIEAVAPPEFVKAVKLAPVRIGEFQIYSKGKGGKAVKPVVFDRTELSDFRVM